MGEGLGSVSGKMGLGKLEGEIRDVVQAVELLYLGRDFYRLDHIKSKQQKWQSQQSK